LRRLQQGLELTGIAALDKEAVRIVAIGQRYVSHIHAVLNESAGQRLRRFLTAAVGIGIKSQVDRSRTITPVADTGAR
jgi:hypothetical protein